MKKTDLCQDRISPIPAALRTRHLTASQIGSTSISTCKRSRTTHKLERRIRLRTKESLKRGVACVQAGWRLSVASLLWNRDS